MTGVVADKLNLLKQKFYTIACWHGLFYSNHPFAVLIIFSIAGMTFP